MSIKHYLSAAAALAMFAACSDYDPGMSNQAVDLTDVEIETIKEYTENFVERYGEMDPNHTWGFGELAEMEEMGTRLSDVNSNEWVEYKIGRGQKKNANGEPLYKGDGGTETTDPYYRNEDGSIRLKEWENNEPFMRDPIELYDHDRLYDLVAKVDIPGFPVHNYYLSEAYNKENAGDPTKPVRYLETQNPENYEGWYHCKVANDNSGREWFSSKEELIDYMYELGATEVIPLGDVANFNTLADAEVADVYAEFSKKWEGTNPEIDLSSYFVQQIWKGTASYDYVDQNGAPGTQVGGDHMDYLVAWGEVVTDNEHFHNYNLSNIANGAKSMMHVTESNTQNFAYKSSLQEASVADPVKWNHYRLVELHGNYYVGFDFESIGEYDKNIPADHVYNDWIVKIIPGTGTINEPDERIRSIKRRVMCEDLGSTFDFDFNDIVFDVEYTREEKKVNGEWVAKKSDGLWDATITLQAVGGTLPIYITNFDGIEYNAHEEMGGTLSSNGTYSPVNVGTSATHAPVTLTKGQVASTNPDNIVIRVTSPDKNRSDEADKASTMILPTAYGAQSGAQSFGTIIAPQKICVPVDTRWTKEYQQIEWAYPHFAEWVTNQNGAAGFGNESDWTTTGVVESYLYP
jgi:hypothetical protein